MERFPKALGSMCDVFFEVPENGNWEGKDDVILGEVGMATWTLYISFGWVYGLQLSSLTKHAIRRCIAFIIFRQNPESDCISKLRSAGILDNTTSMSRFRYEPAVVLVWIDQRYERNDWFGPWLSKSHSDSCRSSKFCS